MVKNNPYPSFMRCYFYPTNGTPIFLDTLSLFNSYEEIIDKLIQKKQIKPLDPPFSYKIVLTLYMFPANSTTSNPLNRPPFFNKGSTQAKNPITLRQGQSIETDYFKIDRSNFIDCAISIEELAISSPKHASSSTSPNWDEITTTVITYIVSAASIIQGLDVVERRWREWRAKHDTHKSTPQNNASHIEKPKVVAIRLLMRYGPEQKIPPEWITEPDRLKHWINLLKDASGSVKPLQVTFQMKDGTRYVHDITEGAQQNDKLDEFLKFLEEDSVKKEN